MWAYKWIIAKTQISQVKVCITGIDISRTFDRIRHEQPIAIVKKFLDEDEVRMIQFLFSNTTLDVRINNPETEPLSRVWALYKVMHSMVHCLSFIREAIYADDADFLTNSEVEKLTTTEKIGEIRSRDNLKVNDSKTEQIEIFQGDRKTERRRTVKKLGSLRRYRTLFKPVLLYNSSTLGLTQKDAKCLDAFQKQQLRHLIGKKFPNKIQTSEHQKKAFLLEMLTYNHCQKHLEHRVICVVFLYFSILLPGTPISAPLPP